MNKKVTLVGIGSAVAMAVIILLVERFANSTVDTISAGQVAAQKDMIREVLAESQQVDIEGETFTYGQALNKIATTQAVMVNQLDALSED